MLLKRIFRFARPHLLFLVLGIFFALTGVLAALVPPELAKRIVDDIMIPASNGNSEDLSGLLINFLLILAAVIIMRAAGIYLRTISLEVFSQRTVKDLKQKLYDHIQSMSFNFFHENRSGELMARMTGDLEAVRDMLSQGLIKLSFGFFYIILTAFVLVGLNWKLALYAIIPSPLVLLVAVTFSKMIRPLIMNIRKQYSVLNTRIQESVSGIRVIKTFNRFIFELDRFNTENYGLSARRNRALGIWAIFTPMLELLSNISMVFLLLFGGKMVIDGTVTLGLWVQFSGYLWMLIMPMRLSGEIVNAFSMASASAERIFQVLDTRTELVEVEDPLSPGTIIGNVEFRNVSWERNGILILNNISFKASPGQVIALMGATGSGKTSIVNLISRFFDPGSGDILIDNRDIREYSLQALRKQIAIVSQEPFLFSETIKANIAYGKVDATREEVKRVARHSCAHAFISSMSRGYDTVVGERGTGLSGGQKQRASIARALIKDAPVLILDDSTSSVDMETEELIQKSLEHYYKHTTVFYIAHRISSVMNADKIMFLENGTIKEKGTHRELLELKGEYYKIYRDQYRDIAAVKEIKGK